MRITDDRYQRDQRRYDLALKLIRHEVRTKIICRWTGLKDERIRTFCRFYAQKPRLRGPSPQKVSFFLREDVRSEGAALAGICRLLGVDERPSLGNGERLCHAFDLYRTCIPDSEIALERAMLLISSLARGDQLQLGHCTQCNAAILIDVLGTARHVCTHCARDSGHVREPEVHMQPDAVPSAEIQQELF